MGRSGATVLQATPATYRLLLEAGWRGNDQLKILVGGEALPQDLANRLLQCGASLWNMYGPTETTLGSAVHRIQPEDDPISIGRPIANTEIYILDKHLQPVPVGVTGALHIAGHGLARGYLNRPRYLPNGTLNVWAVSTAKLRFEAIVLNWERLKFS
jgi:non-ribosomal peptide synthetase component F